MVKVMAALVGAGKVVLTPCVQVRPYDLVIEEEGRFLRVQCKTSRLDRGAVCFRSHRLRAARRETGWQRRMTDYRGVVDFFGVYCPENDRVYLVPLEVTSPRMCSLRVAPARNNQNRKVRWASEYEVVPAERAEQVSDLFGVFDAKGP